MANRSKPFNISILTLTEEDLKRMRPVRSLDMYEGSNNNVFHPDGLFSTLTFGKVGDPLRKARFSYIDLKTELIHPAIWNALGELKRLYIEILEGKTYAVFNAKLKDFERSDATRGRTGYAYFLEYFKRLQFEERNSIDRTENIALVYKWREKCMVDKLVVLPAGYRDVEIENGRPVQDEINDFYRRALAIANTIIPGTEQGLMMDTTRVTLQKNFNDLYANIIDRVDGKHKLIMAKVASRRIQCGTRNVLTSQNNDIAYLGRPGETTMNTTYVGIYQTAVAFLPQAIHALRNKYIANVVPSHSQPARLINKDSLEAEDVTLSAKMYDMFITPEGLERLIHKFGYSGLGYEAVHSGNIPQNKPFVIEDHYFALIYKSADGGFKVFYDIRDFPDGYDRSMVFPISFTELMYCSLFNFTKKTYGYVTRYPVASQGSMYPSEIMLQSTVRYERRYEIELDWHLEPSDDNYAPRFPKLTEAIYQALSPNQAKLANLNADHDGDTGSLDGIWMNESIEEIRKMLRSRQGYIGVDGRFRDSADNDNSKLLFHNLTKPPIMAAHHA